MRGISWLAERLLAPQGWLVSPWYELTLTDKETTKSQWHAENTRRETCDSRVVETWTLLHVSTTRLSHIALSHPFQTLIQTFEIHEEEPSVAQHNTDRQIDSMFSACFRTMILKGSRRRHACIISQVIHIKQ